MAVPGFVTFLMMGDSYSRIIWRGNEINNSRVGVIYGKREHNSHIFSHFVGMPISISYNYLKLIIGESLFEFVLKSEVIPIKMFYITSIQEEIRKLILVDDYQYSLILNSSVRRIVHLLISGIEESYQRVYLLKNNPGLHNRTQYVLDYINENLSNDLTINQIAYDLNLSERTLRFTFRKDLDSSPKKYVKSLLLNAVRKDIISQQDKSTITQIANGWGFWHMGQFSNDYKRLFGELPNQTKKENL